LRYSGHWSSVASLRSAGKRWGVFRNVIVVAIVVIVVVVFVYLILRLF
jgi:t-SNARE complex subunit (syntaxin)